MKKRRKLMAFIKILILLVFLLIFVSVDLYFYIDSTTPKIQYVSIFDPSKDDSAFFKDVPPISDRTIELVFEKKEPEKIRINSVSISNRIIYTSVNEKSTLNIAIYPEEADPEDLIIESNDVTIARVDSDGVIIGVDVGETKIAVRTKGIYIEIDIVVRPAGDKIHYLDVQDADRRHGDAIILESTDINGEKVYGLIDTGVRSMGDRDIEYFRDLGITKFNWILITHFHGDHKGSLSHIMRNGFQVENLYIKEYKAYDSRFDGYDDKEEARQEQLDDYAYIMEMCSKKNVTVKEIALPENHYIELGNFKFKLYNTDNVFEKYKKICNTTTKCNENLNSVVALSTVNNRTILFSGDIENYPTEITSKIKDEELAKNYRNYISYIYGKILKENELNGIDVFKVSHHGIQQHNPESAIKKLKAKYAIITTYKELMKKERYMTLLRLESVGIPKENTYTTGDGNVVMNISYEGEISVTQLEPQGDNKYVKE